MCDLGGRESSLITCVSRLRLDNTARSQSRASTLCVRLTSDTSGSASSVSTQGETRLITLTLTTADLRSTPADDGLVTPQADRPRRRSFSAEDKMRILAEFEALDEPGAPRALLRREGLYSVAPDRRRLSISPFSGLPSRMRVRYSDRSPAHTCLRVGYAAR